MWIKQTTVKTKSGKMSYCQLMQTDYVPGGSRQRLVLSLGPAQRVDLTKARALAKAITAQDWEAIPPELLALLPGLREYGPVLLLLRTYDSTGLWRFCAQAACQAGVEPQAADALFALTAYYFLSYQRGTPFFQWLSDYYVPNRAAVTEAALSQAVALLLRQGLPHPGLAELGRRAMEQDFLGFSYVSACQFDFLPNERPVDTLFLLSSEEVPLACHICEAPDSRVEDILDRSVLVTQNKDFLRRRLEKGPVRYICGLAPGDLEEFSLPSQDVSAFVWEAGEFAPFREYGYREREIGGLRVLVLRTASGPAAAVTQAHREPRDVILTNTHLPTETVLEKYLILEKVLDITHPVYLVEDLQFLRLDYSVEEILRFMNYMQFLQLFVCLTLGKHLTRCRLCLDDALVALRGVRCAELHWGEGQSQLVRSRCTPRQLEILNSVFPGTLHP